MRVANPARAPVDPERGAVTVEAAIGLGALVAVLALVIAGVSAVGGQLRCADAAQEAARLIARGDGGLAEEAVRRMAPGGARLTTAGGGDTVTVRVTADPPVGLLPGVELAAESFAVLEPGVDPVPAGGPPDATP